MLSLREAGSTRTLRASGPACGTHARSEKRAYAMPIRKAES